MDMITVSAKTVDEAITKASIELGTTSDKMEYEVLDKGSTGFLGIGAKPAIIRAKKKESPEDAAVEFLSQIFETMNLDVSITVALNEEEREMSVNLSGEDMGILIGKRGQTLDSLQYLVSLVVNKTKTSEGHIRVKLDTENYRERRKETLETLAKNIAYKVKRTKRSVSLEPMNPYERRIIHAALQNDKYVTTRSDGEEPFRHVIISLKRENYKKDRYGSGDRGLKQQYESSENGANLRKS
ncbi:RNA-binding cell elongation regulator Jag/EloR [Clostridium sp. AM58-1XD]|uniref:RNA-binding cell elongation regulator Jag/EloR n=1 Tax=Clostridium sp. AM58-1XD TaxID=2292307 RepID=UPI000E48C8EE|nr:RNA-binding cell elongation regulator Jag/EloR [Clostridium sp. AM58-1XD]RGY95577.1 protein jag [Clostridium sp. AM58-1XD]